MARNGTRSVDDVGDVAFSQLLLFLCGKQASKKKARENLSSWRESTIKEWKTTKAFEVSTNIFSCSELLPHHTSSLPRQRRNLGIQTWWAWEVKLGSNAFRQRLQLKRCRTTSITSAVTVCDGKASTLQTTQSLSQHFLLTENRVDCS